MKKIILLVLLHINLAAMAQEKQPEVLFEKKPINVLLEQDKDAKTYLTEVAVYKPLNYRGFWGSEMDEQEFQERKIEFTMVYRFTRESKTGRTGTVAVAYFSKDAAGYKIYQSSYLSAWARRESENHPLEPMSYEAARGECVYIGNSDDEKLFAVKVWKYVQKNWKR